MSLRAILIVFFLAQSLHAWGLGLSDDEAYYWVLAQTPAFGYAYHPPAVAWVIALFEKLGWLLGFGISPWTVRLPAILISTALLALGASWLRENGVERARLPSALGVLLAFAGIYALSWMIVPDLPLFLGQTLALLATDRILADRARARDPWLLGAGVALAILSKYSGVLVPVSAFAAALVLGRPQQRWRVFWACLGGGLIAIAPILYWNWSTGWGSLLYQLQGRHAGGGLSFLRFARFVVIQVALAGPLFFYAFVSLRAMPGLAREKKLLWIWVLPPLLIYGLQPLWSEFKPHWMLLAWYPFSLLMALQWTRMGQARNWVIAQGVHAVLAFGLLYSALHYAWIPKAYRLIGGDRPWNPLWDVSADFYGWDALKDSVPLGAPVVASRYQTASQASFALRGRNVVTLWPRPPEQAGEWPEFTAPLSETVYFIADARYSAGPSFESAACVRESRITPIRQGERGKAIEVYRCDPR